MIEYVCQVCRGVVVQHVPDDGGLPDRAGCCPWCVEATAEAVARLRAREEEHHHRHPTRGPRP